MFFVYIDTDADQAKVSNDPSIKPALTPVFATKQQALDVALAKQNQRKESSRRNQRIAELKALGAK